MTGEHAKSKVGWVFVLLATVRSVLVGWEIGGVFGRQSAFEAAQGIHFGRIAGGIYGALFAAVAGALAARHSRRLTLLIGLTAGAIGAIIGSYLETH
jgi:hypothetical protein